MSYKATNWAYDLPLTGSKKFVLVALADMADEENTCYPGQERLGKMTGRSVATVRRALDALEALRLIEREHRIGSGGHRTSDRYRLNLDETMSESLPLKMRTGQSAHSANRTSLPLTVQLPTAHPARVTISRTTSKNHQGAAASQFCGKHPQGTDQNCIGCMNARRAFDAAAQVEREKPTVPGIVTQDDCPKHPHRPLVGCDRCAEEAVAS
ncbi:helix-turn-helix domain-containing protein [Leifsonia sp. NPDC058248]|uniref:helix-turn-helix domain-containing protein n=1 Tax=Leifsonia sp. NPDC058248 TaxID=3346402 RepID=UPI0036DBA1B5